jgi:hypothetical protein
MNNILKVETLLNMFNTVFAKAVYFKDDKAIAKLVTLRHSIYYTDFNFEETQNTLNEIDLSLKEYE